MIDSLEEEGAKKYEGKDFLECQKNKIMEEKDKKIYRNNYSNTNDPFNSYGYGITVYF